MSNNLINPYQQFKDSTGQQRSNGTITFFVNTTTTLATVYSDEALTVAQSNPYTLDAFGRILADVKYADILTIQLANKDGSDIETIDNVLTTNATGSLATDLLSTAVAKGKSLVQGSFIDNVNTVLSASTYTVVLADRGSLIEQTSVQSTTVTLLPAATATDGWTIAFRNNSATGIWTIQGNGGEAINEGLTVILAVGEWCVLVSDGTSAWRALISNEPYLKAVTAITGNTTVDSGDRGLIFNASTSPTVTTPAAATVTEGFSFTVRNSGAGIITVDGNGAETINGSASLALSVQQWATFVSDGTNWSAVGGTTGTISAPSVGLVVQTVNLQDGEKVTGSTALPHDDTIPQSAEGTEFMTLAITPLSITNLLKIEVIFNYEIGSSGLRDIGVALFKDIDASALAAVRNIDSARQVSLIHWVVAGDLTARTYKVRAGTNDGVGINFNAAGGARVFGGVSASTITITEYTA